MEMESYLSIIALNVNELNVPTKRQTLVEWVQKAEPYISCPKDTHLKSRHTYRQKVRSWIKILHANRNQKETGVAILMSDKIDFEIKTMIRGH